MKKHIGKDLLECIYLNDIEQFHELMNTTQFRPDTLDMGYYMACSEGQLEIVKAFIENKYYEFDARLHGCSFEEYGLMAACHKEGKPVREYLVSLIDQPLSYYTQKWFRDNNLTTLQNQIEKKILSKKSRFN